MPDPSHNFYNPWPVEENEVRTIGEFELKKQVSHNKWWPVDYQWRYLGAVHDRQHSYSHSTYRQDFTQWHRFYSRDSRGSIGPNYFVNGLPRALQTIEIRKLFKDDYKSWQKERADFVKKENAKRAEKEGVSLKEAQELRKADRQTAKAVKRTNDIMEVAKHLIRVRDCLDSIIDQLQENHRYPLRQAYELKSAMRDISGDVWRSIKALGYGKRY